MSSLIFFGRLDLWKEIPCASRHFELYRSAPNRDLGCTWVYIVKLLWNFVICRWKSTGA